MMTTPYSKLLTAYPHLCCKLGINQKVNLPMTIPNPGPARTMLPLSRPGTYKLLQSRIQLQEST
eukprot:1146136-Pelagomonas_calceolata.AAC.2